MKRGFFILLLLISCNLAFSQVDTLSTQKSDNKVIIGNHIYYVHIVKKGDSLYSLSRIYNVSQKDIAKENPEIFLGLKIGQALKIPCTDKEQKITSKPGKKDFIYHRVRRKQTVYSLAKKYNVTQEDIFACNPNARYGINVNQIIKIPKSREVVEAIQKFPLEKNNEDTIKLTDRFIYHKVEKGDTEFSLSRHYEITEEMLKEHNPSLTDGLKIGQILKIPKIENEETSTILLIEDKHGEDTSYYKQRALMAFSDSISFLECDKILEKQDSPYNIALLLPFYLEKNDEEFYIDSSEVDDFGKKIYETVYYPPYHIYPKSMSFIEFYEGFLLAVDTLKKQGLSINLHVYDTRNDTTRIKEILDYPELQTMELIIGPVYNHEVKLVSKFSKENQIKMISPLTDNLKLVEQNNKLFQVFPSYNAQIDEFAEFVSTFEDKNIVLAHNGDSLQYVGIQNVKSKIFSNLSEDTLINYIQFKEVVFKDSINVLAHALDNEKENIFIIPSNEQAFVADLVNNLNTLKTFGHNIKVVGLARWQRFTNIDPEFYFNLQLNIVAPFFVDYHNKNVKEFILNYRQAYKTEPDNMAMHGYDVGLYFLSALKDYGVHFENCIFNHKVNLLQANYKFVKWYRNSGYENIGVDIIKYDQGYQIYRNKYKQNSSEYFQGNNTFKIYSKNKHLSNNP